MTMKENENAASFDFDSFTDKKVMECDLPELEVCYKDIDCQFLKDICVDEGRPEKDINVIESFNDEKPGLSFPEPTNDKVLSFEAAEDSSKECTNDLSANQCSSKEANDEGNLVSEVKLETSLDNSFDKVSAKYCDLDNSVQIDETYYGADGKAETDSSDFSARNNVTQPPDQVLNGKTDSEIPDASSAEVGGKAEDITFNFDSPGPVVVDNGVTASEDEHSGESADAAIKEHSAELADAVIKQHSAELADAVIKEHSAELADAVITENVQVQLVDIEDRNYDGGSATSSDQYVESEDNCGETAQENATNHDYSSSDPVRISSNENLQAVEPKTPQHEGNNSAGNASVVNQLYRDEGETSFSAASLINYSGQIAFSGSLSHRSDGSTTSAKSFAFPVLQSEWHSSPVRMAKADRRNFRKQKSWTSGLLCCRF